MMPKKLQVAPIRISSVEQGLGVFLSLFHSFCVQVNIAGQVSEGQQTLGPFSCTRWWPQCVESVAQTAKSAAIARGSGRV
jgi:hypothetical protein